MHIELTCNDLHAVTESHGGELISLLDANGVEYIWGGIAPYWSGRNPVLFPIVGRLRDGMTRFDGNTYEMAQHGFARNQEFSVVEQTAERVVLN